MTRRKWTGTMWLTLAFTAAAARGQTVQNNLPPIDSVAQAAKALESDQWAVREAGESYLLHQPPACLSQLESVFRESNDPEVVARLAQVCRHLFLKDRTGFNGPTALLGIRLNMETVQLDPKSPDRRVVVAVGDLQPGFPAAEELRVGDLILAVEGQVFSDDTTGEAFRHEVASHKPGERIHLTVLRAGRQFEAEVPLAGIMVNNQNALGGNAVQGVPQPGVMGALELQDFVAERLRAARAYLASVRSRPADKEGADAAGQGSDTILLHGSPRAPADPAAPRFDNF